MFSSSVCVATCTYHDTCDYYYRATAVPSTDASSSRRSLHCIWFTILIKGHSSSIATQPPYSTAVYHYCTATVPCFCCKAVACIWFVNSHQRLVVAVTVLTALHYALVDRCSRRFLHSWCQYTLAFPCSEVAAHCSSLAAIRPSLIPSVIHDHLTDTSIV